MVEEMLDIARDSNARRNLGARVQHANHLAELRVLDDAERAVAARAPQGQQEP